MSEPNLNDLGVRARAVATVEDDVLADAHARATVAEQDDYEQAIATVEDHLVKLRTEERSLKNSLHDRVPSAKFQALRKRIETAIARKQALFDAHEERKRLSSSSSVAIVSDKQAQGESHRDFLIRTGKLTPFQGQQGYERQPTDIEPTRRRVAHSFLSESLKIPEVESSSNFGDKYGPECTSPRASEHMRQNLDSKNESDLSEKHEGTPATGSLKRSRSMSDSDEDEYNPELSASSSDSGEGDANFNPKCSSSSRPQTRKKMRTSRSSTLATAGVDNERFAEKGSLKTSGDNSKDGDDITLAEEEEVEFEGGLRVPGSVYDRLFAYQRTGVSMSSL